MILATHGIVASQIVTVPVATAATGIGETSFTANWNAYTGADYYLLDVSEFSNFSTFVYEDQIVLAPNTSYVVIGLNPNTTYYYRIRANVGYDPEAQAFFDRVTTAGGSLSTAEQDAVNDLVIQMKVDGIWTKMKAIYPMVGGGDPDPAKAAAACAQNLKSSSFTGTFSSGWTFASTGVTPDGFSAYMDTGLNASTQLSTPSHLSKYTGTNDNTGTDEIDMGVRDFWLSLWYNGSGLNDLLARNQSVNVLLNGGTVTDSRGFGLTTKISNTAKIFMNNVQKDSKTDTTTIYTDNNIYLGSYNANGADLFSKRDFRFASIGDGLTDTEASDFYTAVQTFQTTLSRQV